MELRPRTIFLHLWGSLKSVSVAQVSVWVWMQHWQSILCFALQKSSDPEGSDGCGDDSDWASSWLHVGPLLLAVPFVYKKVAFPNPRIHWNRSWCACRMRTGCPGEPGWGRQCSRKARSFLYHWLIHLTDILENSVVGKQLSKNNLEMQDILIAIWIMFFIMFTWKIVF